MTDDGKRDVNDTLQEGGPEAVREMADQRARDERPTVRVGLNDQLRTVVSEAWDAVGRLEGRDGVYLRADVLCRVYGDPPRIDGVGADALLSVLADAADWQGEVRRRKGTDWDAIAPPERAIRIMRARPHPAVRPLSGIVTVPVLDADGQVVQRPGYHHGAEVWFEPAGRFEPIPDVPSRDDVAAALEVLADPLADYQWESASDYAAALAMLLTPAVRRMVLHVPLMVCDAPERGSGKSLLARVVAYVAGVGRTGVIPYRGDKGAADEVRKTITSLLTQGSPVIVLDNIKGRLESSELETALTTDVWSDRILGENRMVDLPQRAIWVLTSNNASLGEDLSRRAVRIRINARCDQPWLRDTRGFKHPDLVGHMADHYLEVARAAAVLARAWVVAGQPPGPNPLLGSFERWSEVVGGVLHFAGVEGFLSNLDEVYGQFNDRGVEDRAFVAAWARKALPNLNLEGQYDSDRAKKYSAKELVGLAKDAGVPESVLSIETDRGQQTAMANVLKRLLGRTFVVAHDGEDEDGLVRRWSVVIDTGERGRRVYVLEPVTDGDPVCQTSPIAPAPEDRGSA